MTTWIFQGNPSIFDMDGYLQSAPGAITWLAKQNAKDMRLGDKIFLWRSAGKGKDAKSSGIIASGELISETSLMAAEPESQQFWLDKSKVGTAQTRVWLKLTRVANSKEVLKREWLLEDACLRNMLILKQAAGTNFKLTLSEGERLEKMWSRVGQDWNRTESIAGLWAYLETYGREVSRLVDSPVEQISQLTGRAVGAVYNKVLNFRSIDPRDNRKGMSGGGHTDRAVWAEFFDLPTQTLNEKGVSDEFDRLWGNMPTGFGETQSDAHAVAEVFSTEVVKLLGCSLEELIAAYNRQEKKLQANAGRRPKTRSGRTILYDRNPLVVAIAKTRAAGKCEVFACTHEQFLDPNDFPYCEVHHIEPLSEGGVDKIENVVCLCPTHHREAHFGKNACVLRFLFEKIRS